MPKKVDEIELKVLMVKHPQEPDSFFAAHFHVSNEAIRKRRRKLEAQLQSLVQADNNARLGQVANATTDTLTGDIETLRRIAMSELKTALDGKDKKALAVWYDKLTMNAKLRADISKSLNILIDNRSVNIVQTLEDGVPILIRVMRRLLPPDMVDRVIAEWKEEAERGG